MDHTVTPHQGRAPRPIRTGLAVRWEVTCYSEVVAIAAIDRVAEEKRRVRDEIAGAVHDAIAAVHAGAPTTFAAEALAIHQEAGKRPAEATRGDVEGWSDKSRRRMMRTLGSLDLADARVCMVTLTLPGVWWLTRDGAWRTPKVLKAEVDAWRKRVERATGHPVQGFWKMETQRRGAPHFHIGMVIPERLNAKEYRDTLAKSWRAVIGGDEQHERYGVHMDVTYANKIRNGRSTLAAYFSKHGVWRSKEYQNQTPGSVVAGCARMVRGLAPTGSLVTDEDRLFGFHRAPADPLAAWDAFAEAWRKPGRWWGLWRLEVELCDVAPDEEQRTIHVARLLARKVYGRRSQRLAVDANLGTVVVRHSLRSLHGDADRGWWMTAKDGPAFMRWLLLTARELHHLHGLDLARAIAAVDLPATEKPRMYRNERARVPVLV